MVKLNSVEEPILNRILTIRRKEALYRRRIAFLIATSQWVASLMPLLILGILEYFLGLNSLSVNMN
jgi:hypothetical protein